MTVEDSWDINASKPQPVHVGDEVKLSVRGTGSKGDFYGTHMGLIIFIRNLKKCSVGEQVSVRIAEVRDKCAFAEKV